MLSNWHQGRSHCPLSSTTQTMNLAPSTTKAPQDTLTTETGRTHCTSGWRLPFHQVAVTTHTWSPSSRWFPGLPPMPPSQQPHKAKALSQSSTKGSCGHPSTPAQWQRVPQTSPQGTPQEDLVPPEHPGRCWQPAAATAWVGTQLSFKALLKDSSFTFEIFFVGFFFFFAILPLFCSFGFGFHLDQKATN